MEFLMQFLYLFVTLPILGPGIFLSFCFSPDMTDQYSHSHKTTNKISYARGVY
jgi:hypothetical protein